MRRLLGHLPQTVVGVEIAVGMPKLGKPTCEHREMACFVVRTRRPITIVRVGLAAKTVNRIPGEIDRIELDVCDRMHERGATLGRTETALGQFTRRDQTRALRS